MADDRVHPPHRPPDGSGPGLTAPWWETGAGPQPMWPTGSRPGRRKRLTLVVAGLAVAGFLVFFIWIGVVAANVG